MGYICDLKDLRPGDHLMIIVDEDGDLSIDYAEAERDAYEFLHSQVIVFVEVNRILQVFMQEKEK